MQPLQVLSEAMEAFYEAEALTLHFMPGASMVRRERFQHIHYEKPLWWETDSFHTAHTQPTEVIEDIRACQPGPHLIALATTNPAGVIAEYAAVGYKTVPTEPIETIMVRSLKPYALGVEKHCVQRVQTEEQRQFFNSVIEEDDPHGQMKAEELSDPAVRHYYIEIDGICVCHGRALLPLPDAVVIEPLGTDAGYRRRGLATALMNRVHADAVATGAERSVILATAMGAALYTTLGYEIIGYIQKFVPKDWKREDYA